MQLQENRSNSLRSPALQSRFAHLPPLSQSPLVDVLNGHVYLLLDCFGKTHERSEGHGKQAKGTGGEMGVIGCINGFELLNC